MELNISQHNLITTLKLDLKYVVMRSLSKSKSRIVLTVCNCIYLQGPIMKFVALALTLLLACYTQGGSTLTELNTDLHIVRQSNVHIWIWNWLMAWSFACQ